MPWYALQVHTGYEGQVAGGLHREHIETYWPTYQQHIRHARGVQTIERSLFPGYLFAEFCGRFHSSVPRIVRVLGYGLKQVVITPEEIASVRTISQLPQARPCDYPTAAMLHAGQRVVISSGPLSGMSAVVLRANRNTDRVVVSLDMIARSVSAEVAAGILELRP